MKRIFLILVFGGLLIIVFQSCVQKGLCDSPELPYQVLTDSIRVWLPYTRDSNIIFEDTTLQTDTIRLSNFFSGDAEIFRGDECALSTGQFVRVNFIDLLSRDTIKAEIGYKNIFSTERKSTYVAYNDDIKNIGNPSQNRKYEHSITLDAKSFIDCIWVECIESDNCDSNGITKYYFAKKKGLIGYVRNNTLWTLK